MRFKFGKTVSIGLVSFGFSCPNCGNLGLDIDVVDLDVLLLLGLREIRSHRLFVEFSNNPVESNQLGWNAPIHDKNDHLFWVMAESSHFTPWPKSNGCINNFSTRRAV